MLHSFFFIVFRHWTRKKYAIFNTLRKVIRIGTLAVTYSLQVLPGKSHAQAELLSGYARYYLKHQVTTSVDFRKAEKLVSSLRLTWHDHNGTYQDAVGTVVPYTSFWLADAKVSWNTKYLTFFTTATSFLNTRYFDFGGIIQPGTWIQAGIAVDWNYH